MRSRYTAFVRGDADHLFRTWHPRTRPAVVEPTPGIAWLGLTVLDTVAGGVDDQTGEVEFAARFTAGRRNDAPYARSRFTRRAGRWLYFDGSRSD